VAAFFALVWFDSAAFTALQLTPEIHDRHWGSETMRWSNGTLHACAAVAAGVLLDRGGLRILLALALVLLAFGAWSFGGGGVTGNLAAPAYVTGVSWYSTALAAFAALAPDGTGNRDSAPWRAAWLYGIAGWIGSAAGVGLAEQFGVLPRWALPAAAVVVAAGLLWSGRRSSKEEARP
jgi:cytochrome c oxidase cbb3-type subunit 2